MTSFAYWAPLPHTPRRPPIRSQRAADHARAATRVSRASAALYWRPEPTEVSLSHTLAGFIRGGLFVVVFFFFCSIQAGSSSTWILASSTAALTLFEGAADRRVNPQKPTPAVEKLLLCAPVGFKVQLTVASPATQQVVSSRKKLWKVAMAAVCQPRRALVEIPAPQPKIAGKSR